MKIWAHRGCSQMYPENTILAFEKASEINGLTGIELDIQLSRDGYLVVCHDERVDRTTDGIGEVRNYTLAELRKLRIDAGNGMAERIPVIEEVLDLLKPKFAEGFLLNIELKNSIFAYEGMEEKIVSLIAERGLYVVRAWFTGHLYPEKPTGGRLNLVALERSGITDVFLNEPEAYCGDILC